MAEGRVRANGGSLTYEYCITDHQGNSRVSFEAYSNGGTIIAKLVQENHYYPFGMSITGMAIRTASPSNPNKNLYNQGSEFQDDFGDSPGFYSTGFREYDPVLGRFNGVDPLADLFADWTPYTYAYNNPVVFNDPTGLAGRDPKPGQSMKKPRRRHTTKSGGGDNYETQLEDYSGMADQGTDIDLQYDESTDDEVENNEHINEDNNLAYEAYSRWKSHEREESDEDEDEKGGGKGWRTDENNLYEAGDPNKKSHLDIVIDFWYDFFKFGFGDNDKSSLEKVQEIEQDFANGQLGGQLLAATGAIKLPSFKKSPVKVPTSQVNRIYSARVLIRSATETGPFHNFPESINITIFQRGSKTITPNYFNVAKPGLSNTNILYQMPGAINGTSGMYEIGVRPSLSGNTEVIMHIFFRPIK